MKRPCGQEEVSPCSDLASFYVVHLGCWDGANRLARELADTQGGWRFRGQADASWPLTTTLERAANSLRSQNPGYAKNPLRGLSDVERRILMTFRPQAHLHGVSVPYAASPIEWLAMVQHYGGPTRLLDFTESFWVAVFHAIQPSHRRPTGDASHAVWAVRTKPLWNKAIGALGLWGSLPANDTRVKQERQRIAREQCVAHMRLSIEWRLQVPKDRPSLAFPVQPEFLNARLRAQQGCFVFPLDDEARFEKNLFQTFRLAPPPDAEDDRGRWSADNSIQVDNLLAKLKLGKHTITDAFEPRVEKPVLLEVILPSSGSKIRRPLQMLQGMNITWGTLFPDLHGIALSGISAITH